MERIASVLITGGLFFSFLPVSFAESTLSPATLVSAGNRVTANRIKAASDAKIASKSKKSGQSYFVKNNKKATQKNIRKATPAPKERAATKEIKKTKKATAPKKK
jgi:hypothetical protein